MVVVWSMGQDGTAGENDRGSCLAVRVPARAMGEARPWRREPRRRALPGPRPAWRVGRRPLLAVREHRGAEAITVGAEADGRPAVGG